MDPLWYSTCHYPWAKESSNHTVVGGLSVVNFLEIRGRFRTALLCLALCIVLALSQGCAKLGHAEPEASSSADQQNLPFHPSADQAADDTARPSVPSDQKPTLGAPFPRTAHSHILPAGTLITVQLESALPISRIHAGDRFTASVTGAVTAQGNILIAKGTMARGEVESSRPPTLRSSLLADPGYAQLDLTSIILDGKAVALQTSTLFAKGTLLSAISESDARSDDFQLIKGRRLTFRLTAPLMLGDQSSIANR
jgi:hypothetical protein